MRTGRAYPCFATKEELTEIAEAQRTLKLPTGYYGRWAPWRDADGTLDCDPTLVPPGP